MLNPSPHTSSISQFSPNLQQKSFQTSPQLLVPPLRLATFPQPPLVHWSLFHLTTGPPPAAGRQAGPYFTCAISPLLLLLFPPLSCPGAPGCVTGALAAALGWCCTMHQNQVHRPTEIPDQQDWAGLLASSMENQLRAAPKLSNRVSQGVIAG